MTADSSALSESASAAGDPPTPPPIEVDDLSVSFGDVPVVSGVDLGVERGSLVGLVGPNGAGKTTVLRAIKGTLSPDTGTVRLDGDPTTALSARETGRRVASVPQETTLGFDFRVRQIVEMGRTPHLGRFDGHGPDDERAVREAMADAGVARFADRSITEVSGGERQRVLLARALAQETPSLLLDEPTASLDVTHAVRTLELVRDLVDDGRAALAAIHDLDMAARYCDRIVVLANGGVHAAGPPETVLTATALRAAFDAEAFVGENPATGSPTVTAFDAAGPDAPTGSDASESNATRRRVHVVGGGRPAARAVARLSAAGHVVSVGVVPEGDTAAGVAVDAARGAEADGGDAEASARVVTAPPFAPVPPEREAEAVALAREADVTVAVGGDERGDSGVNAAVLAASDRVVHVGTDGDARAAVRGIEPDTDGQ
ncbi:ATP-binding cassette domain-containing protein [Halorubrum halophilum]|uniref:ATP-binding cassette domain-containing protein n=1 Tax=Halorubrum halophilum TaxID=413816 RepID=UPI00186B4001|nr:ATP-binding cassette domain-containing protein [Halorubrum halophilum]